jgi:hypothetical protein
MSTRSREESIEFTRREFLAISSGVVGYSLTAPPALAEEIGEELPTHRFRVRRDADLLSLEISFVNFERKKGFLCALGAGRSLVIVRFPPQNLAEAIFDRPPSGLGFEIQPIGSEISGANCRVASKTSTEGVNCAVPPVRAYLSGPSWVVFSVPDGIIEPDDVPDRDHAGVRRADGQLRMRRLKLPLTKAALGQSKECFERVDGLGENTSVVDYWLRLMANWKIRLPANAINPGQPAMPRGDQTCLEIPFRLFIAPTKENTRLLSSSESQWILGDVTPGRPRELWHAAILCREKLTPATLPKGTHIDLKKNPELAPASFVTTQARAVFTPDDPPNGVAPPTNIYYPDNRMLSLKTSSRRALVEQMALGNGWIDAEHLILSSLGCDANLSYTSQTSFQDIIACQLESNGRKDGPPSSLGLAIWKHRIVVGRDVFFIEAYPGFLMPHVNQCFYVELTKRRFAAYPKDQSKPRESFSAPGAYLLKEYYIVCVDPTKSFGAAENCIARGMPIKRAVLTETRSPLLIDPMKYFKLTDDIDNAKVAKLSTAEQALVNPVIANPTDQINNRYFFIPRPLRNYCPTDTNADGVRWNVALTDGEKQPSQAQTCLMFATNAVVGCSLWNCLRDEYQRATVPAQKVAYAPNKPVLVVPAAARGGKTPPPAPQELQDTERQAATTLGNAIRSWSDVRTKILQKLQPGASAVTYAQQCAQDLLDIINKSGSGLVSALSQDLSAYAARLTDAQRTELQETIKSAINTLTDAEQAVRQLEAKTWKQVANIANVINNSLTKAKDKATAVTDLLQQLSRAQAVSSTLETHGLTFLCGRLAKTIVGDGRIKEASQNIQKVLNAAQNVDDFIHQIEALGPDKPHPQYPTELLQDSYWYQRIHGQLQSLVEAANVDALTGKPIADAKKALAQLQQTAGSYLKELKDAEADLTQVGNQWFHSQLASADVMIPALKAMMPDAPIAAIGHVDDFLARGINGVESGVFAKLEQAVDPGGAIAKQVQSGLAQPAMKLAGLSRDLGALTAQGQDTVKQLARQVTGIDLSQALPDAKLFGVLSLKDLIGSAKDEAKGALDSANLPTINLADLPDKYVHTWQWSVPVHDLDLGLVKFVPKEGGPFPVLLHLSLTTEIDRPNSVQQAAAATSNPQSLEQLGKVTLDGFLGFWDDQAKQGYTDDTGPNEFAFELILLGMVDAQFGYLKMHAEGRQGEALKPKLEPRINYVQFMGPLQFVRDLEDELRDLLGGGFVLDVTPSGLNVGFDLGPIDIGIGVVSLMGVSVGAALTLPFDANPLKFSFHFCTFDDPCVLSVLLFGGGGFFECSLESGGGRSLRAAMEFGGALSFNVVVAKGDLSIMAGIYFSLDNQTAVVAAFFRAGGHLEVLCLLNASVEFLLMLGYRHGPGVSLLYGIASLTVSIDLFMFHKDVSITMEKTFAGSSDRSPPPSPNLGGLLGRRARILFVSQTAPAPKFELPKPMAYFKPRLEEGIPESAVGYRFESEKEWNRRYWSQFAF